MKALTALLAATVSILPATAALALDYRSLGDNAVLYDAPSVKGVKHYIIARGTPVEVVLTQDYWTKVRDGSGNMAWVETRLLSSTRTLQVRADKADVRAEANDKSPVVFSAEKNVLLELVDAGSGNAATAAPSTTPGWAKVRHRDGQVGFIRASQVWGL